MKQTQNYFSKIDRQATRYFEDKLISFKTYIVGKIPFLCISIGLTIILVLASLAFRVHIQMIILIIIIMAIITISEVTIEYLCRQRFYRALAENLAKLDQAYLILETLEPPHFYDGKIFCETLYQVNKSAAEQIELYAGRTQSFREYVELWIHEVKTPLTTLGLMSHSPAISEQLRRLNNYVEQVLYFVRAENAEHDYLIQPVILADVVKSVAVLNREVLQAKHIDFNVKNLNIEVFSDAKWLEFILGQIIMNSIKYRSTRIEVFALESAQEVTLKIIDNGIGIAKKDLPRVFNKSFTGENGHLAGRQNQSTGMGLYIVKTLCDKLGHRIEISSEQNRWTAVEITFFKNDYYQVVDKPNAQNITKK